MPPRPDRRAARADPAFLVGDSSVIGKQAPVSRRRDRERYGKRSSGGHRGGAATHGEGPGRSIATRATTNFGRSSRPKVASTSLTTEQCPTHPSGGPASRSQRAADIRIGPAGATPRRAIDLGPIAANAPLGPSGGRRSPPRRPRRSPRARASRRRLVRLGARRARNLAQPHQGLGDLGLYSAASLGSRSWRIRARVRERSALRGVLAEGLAEPRRGRPGSPSRPTPSSGRTSVTPSASGRASRDAREPARAGARGGSGGGSSRPGRRACGRPPRPRPRAAGDLGEPGVAGRAGVGLEVAGPLGRQWPRSNGRPSDPARSATNRASARPPRPGPRGRGGRPRAQVERPAPRAEPEQADAVAPARDRDDPPRAQAPRRVGGSGPDGPDRRRRMASGDPVVDLTLESTLASRWRRLSAHRRAGIRPAQEAAGPRPDPPPIRSQTAVSAAGPGRRPRSGYNALADECRDHSATLLPLPPMPRPRSIALTAPPALRCPAALATIPSRRRHPPARGRGVRRELRPAVEPLRRGPRRGGRGRLRASRRASTRATWRASSCSTPAAAAAGMPGWPGGTGRGSSAST